MNASLRANHRPTLRWVALCAAVAGWAPSPTRADGLVEEGIRVPLIMLAIDTSGSMEYEDQSDEIVPSCPTLGPYRRNRWAIALEVLTGSFDTFTCELDDRLLPVTREDYAYPIPHVTYDVTQQSPNGLIDLHADVVKFAYATFDTEFDTDTGVAGGWSYASDRSHPLLGLINLGIKNDQATAANASVTAGAFLPFIADDSPSTLLRTANLAVEQALFGTIPYGGTPIAPMLSDIEEYFTGEPTLQPYDANAGTGDPFYDCRPRFTILITDGLPTQGEGTDEGYTTSAQAASTLYGSHPQGVRTFVVGFALEGGSVPAEIESIAQAGDPLCTEPPCAFVANNQSELVLALSQIIGEILTGRYSRTTAIHTNVTRNAGDAQYQFNTGWGSVPVNSIDRQGFLEQAIYRCTADCQSDTGGAGICDVFSLSDAVNAQEEPAPVYVIDDTSFVQLTATNSAITPDLLNIPNQGTAANPGEPPVALLDLEPIGEPGARQLLGTETLGYSDDEAVREAYKQQLVELLLAAPDSRRFGYRMGAIRYGTPAVVSRPATGVSQRPSYAQYQEQNRYRPTVLFAPTQMGELMAIRVDRGPELSAATYGQHLWSIIPRHLVSKLEGHAAQTLYLMDLPTVVRDVLLARNLDDIEPVEESAQWRTVLVQGYRDGGRGYFALDVTDPTNPALLWEIDPDQRCTGFGASGTCSPATTIDGKSDFCHLGFTYSPPVLGNVFLNAGTYTNEERAVAVFGGGRFDESDDQPEAYSCGTSLVFNEADIGRGFFVVDLSTGEKLMEFRAGNGSVPADDETRLLYDFVGAPTCFNTGADAVMTRCFIGDAGGQLWRIDLANGDPSAWSMQLFYDPYDGGPLDGLTRGPIFGKPALALDSITGRLSVVYGTGNVDSVLALGAAHGVFSVAERVTLDDQGVLDPTTGISGTLSWSKTFTDGTMVMGSPVIFDRVAYFTTYRIDAEAACTIAADAALLWGVHYANSTTGDPDTPGEPIGAIPDPDDPASDVKLLNIPLSPGVPTGVTIVTRPSCVGNEALAFDPILGSMGGSGSDTGSGGPASMGGSGGAGAVELVVQYQGAGVELSGGASTPAPKVETSPIRLQRPRSTVYPLSWALVFD